MHPERKLDPTRPHRWILLRGLVREAGHWGDFPLRLRARFPGSEVHCLDAPGNGRHWKNSSPLSVSRIVDSMRRDFLDIVARESGTPNYLVAISLGGMIAIDWLTRFPGDAGAAVLINTSLRGMSPFYRRLDYHAMPSLLRIFLEKDALRRESMILELTSSGRNAPAAVGRAAIFQSRPVSRLNAIRQLYAASRFSAPTRAPGLPLLVLNGMGDRFVSPICSEQLAMKWNLDLRRHPLAGHDLPLDDPDWILSQIEQWMER